MEIMAHNKWLCLIVILANVCLVQSLESSSLLDTENFSIRSTVTYVLGKTSGIKFKSLESYSHEQRRAKVDYVIEATFDNGDNKLDVRSGVFYVDKSGRSKQTVVFADKDNRKCKQSSVDDMLKQSLIGSSLGKIMEEREQDDDNIAPSYMIGPVRLLSFIMKNQHKLERNESEPDKTIRNIPAKLYTLDYNTEALNYPRIKFQVYLSQELASNSYRNAQLWPIRINFDVGTIESYIIDFSLLEIFDQENPDDNYEQLHESGGNLGLDRFMIPPISGCYAAFAGEELQLFANRSVATDRFSFMADIDYNLLDGKRRPIWLKTFVAFNGRLNSMMYDLRGTSASSVDPESQTSVRKLLYNFKTNRVYHLVERGKPLNGERQTSFVDRVLDLSQELKLDESGRTGSGQCAVAEIVPEELLAGASLASNSKSMFTLGQLLMGADKFVYLGRAQVRGIRALVYESAAGPGSQDVPLPFWLETPMYQRLRENNRAEHYKSTVFQQGLEFHTVLYMAAAELADNQVPLMMEIYTIDPAEKKPVHLRQQRHTIYFYDFTWNLDHMPPDGQPPTELFSLQDRCSSDTSGGLMEHASIEMLLEVDRSSCSQAALEEIQSPNFRNLGLLASLQDTFKLPASMIFGLESRFLDRRERGQSPQNNLISVSFQLAEHYQKLARMVFLGIGDVYGAYKGPLEVLRVRSLQACFFHAAHIRGARILFAYHEQKRECYIDLAPFDGTANIYGPDIKLNLPSFYLYPRQTFDNPRAMSLFMTVYENDNSIGLKSNRWIEELSNLRGRVKMFNTELTIPDVKLDENSTKGIVKLKVRRVNLMQNSHIRSFSNGTSQLLYGDRLAGFGLLEADSKLNRLLDPAQLDLEKWRKASRSNLPEEAGFSAMSLDQCKSACLADFDCQSFSVCLSLGQIECILSRVSFRDERVLRKLEEQVEKGDSLEKILKIQLEDEGQSLQIERKQSCEIVNKDYLSLYRKPEPIKVHFSRRQVIPVANEEICAELCTKLNVKFMGGTNQPREAESATPSTNGFHQMITRQVCKAFLYTDRVSITDELDRRMAANVLQTGSAQGQEETSGYCILGESASQEETDRMRDLIASRSARKSADTEINSITTLKIYYFRYEHFYQKLFGVRLLPSQMSVSEEAAFNVVRELLRMDDSNMAPDNWRESPIYQESIRTMENFVASGNNIVVKVSADESKCAKYCFLQFFTPWPACKSFDVLVERLSIGDTDQQMLICHLNSMTIGEAVTKNKFDLIEEDSVNRSVVHRLHFETRLGFATEENQLEVETSSQMIGGIVSKLAKQQSFRIHAFGATFLALLGLICGIVLGIKFAPGLLARTSRTGGGGGGDDKAALVNGKRRVDFVNQVNSEGAIPEMVA